jgi:tetratricopeptide (TPR) repeat protein
VKHTSYWRSPITRCLVLALCAAVATFAAPASLSTRLAHAEEPARAADPSAEPAAYRGVVREALAEYTAKNFPEARALFAEAHRLYPNARTLRGLGMTAFELRSYRESIAYLNEALASSVKPLDAALRAETERLLTRAERFVGKLNLAVNPASAEVLLDGNPVKNVEGTPLLLEVGEHSLEFRAEGYAPETRSLYVKGHEIETWSVVLNKLPAPVVPAPAEVAERAEHESAGPQYLDPHGNDDRRSKQPLYKNPWLWTGVGAAVVAIVVTSVVLATRENEVARAEIGDNTPARGVFRALESGSP